MNINLTLVPKGFHTREFADPAKVKVNHILHANGRSCVHMHLGKPCGKVVETTRPNGWLCGFHDSIVFPKPVAKVTEVGREAQ